MWHGADRAENRRLLKKSDVVVTSYAILRRDIDELSKVRFRYVILDEAQFIKNWATTTAKSVNKCRDAINKGKTTGDPKACATADTKAAAKIEKAAQKVRDAVLASCSVASLAEVDICGAGVGGIATVLDAQSCLVEVGRFVRSPKRFVRDVKVALKTLLGRTRPGVRLLSVWSRSHRH